MRRVWAVVAVMVACTGVFAAGLPVSGAAAVVTVAAGAEPSSGFQVLPPARLLDTRAGATTVDGTQAGGGALGPGETRTVPVVGRGGVPLAGVGAVVLNVTVDRSSSGGFLTVFPSGGGRPNASNLNFSAGETIANLVVAKVGDDGRVAIHNPFGSTPVLADVAGWFPAGSSYTGLNPARLLDTRAGATTVDGTQEGGGALGPGETRTVPVVGRGGVPLAGVSAVVLNVTVDRSSSGGFLTVFPSGGGRPNASNLNFSAGETIANLVVAKVGDDGRVAIHNPFGSTPVLADVAGWFPAGSSYTGLNPARLLDTRAGATTVDGTQAGGGALGPGETRTVPVVGRGGVPLAGVSAVVLNVTVDKPSSGGYLTVYPSSIPRPNASNLNFSTGQTIPNLVIAKVGVDGSVAIHNPYGSTPVIVDVAGWFPVTPLTGIVSIAPGSRHTCALIEGGQVRCWGENWDGQLGNGSTEPSGSPISVVGISGAIELSAGGAHNCVLLADGTIKCWGYNFAGEVGSPLAQAGIVVPISVPGISGATAVSAGGLHSCAIVAGGHVKCWGFNSYGELGDGTRTNSWNPVEVVGITDATAISTGGIYSCAIVTGGAVKCWGDNSSGSLGDGGQLGSSATPVAVVGVASANGLSAGDGHACVLVSGAVKCWGYNGSGQIGDGTTTTRPTPVDIASVSDATSVLAGSAHTCALLAGGQAVCWGGNQLGQLGNGTTTASASAVPVEGIDSGTMIATRYSTSCALLAGGRARCWGNGSSAQLGNGSWGTFSTTPVSVLP